MATEISLPWDGVDIGDAAALAPYSETQWDTIYETLWGAGHAAGTSTPARLNNGVLKGYLNELEVTGASTPVSVDKGGALVKGKWYDNDASLTIAVTTPAVDDRTDYIVLRTDWSAKTIRAVVKENPVEGTGTPPALTQTDGTTWEIPLAELLVAHITGAITVTDAREWATPNVEITTPHLADDAVTGPKLRDSAEYSVMGKSDAGAGDPEDIALATNTILGRVAGDVEDIAVGANTVLGRVAGNIVAAQAVAAQIAADAVTTVKILDENVTKAKLVHSAAYSVVGKATAGVGDPADIVAGANAVLGREAGDMAFAQVATAQIANDAVDDTKAGARVAQFYRRQGGSATIWSSGGSTDYVPTAVRMQGGSYAWSGSAAASGSFTVTFPVAFSYTPLLYLTFIYKTVHAFLAVVNMSATQFDIIWETESGTVTEVDMFWLAIGPE